MRASTVAASLVLWVCAAAPMPAQEVDTTWVGGIDVWGQPGNWSGEEVPNNDGTTSYTVLIDSGPIKPIVANGAVGDSVVFVESSDRLSSGIVDFGDAIEIQNARSLVIDGGPLINDGEIRLVGTSLGTALRPDNGVSIEGSGAITMGGSVNQLRPNGGTMHHG